MAADSLPEERTEDPSERRMGEYRKEGDLFISSEVVLVVSLMTAFLSLRTLSDWLLTGLISVMRESFEQIGVRQSLTAHSAGQLLSRFLYQVTPPVAILSVAVAIAASLAVMLQSNWNRREKLIQFRFHFLNPLTGIRRIFSIQGAVTTGKALVKLIFFMFIGLLSIKGIVGELPLLVMMTVEGVGEFMTTRSSNLVWRILSALLVLAVFDYAYGKWRWMRDHRMTKDEVKDERKSVEGDEATKRQIISKGIQRGRQRLMATVPTADVIITNPTHFAVALKYERDRMRAPIVVAKGQDEMALRIREIAKEHNVPIVERRELARALYRSVKIGAEIPGDLFRAVAEVLAYVYSVKRKRVGT